METKWNKGPWNKCDKRKEGYSGFSIFADGQYVAFVGDSDGETDWEANANLVAA